MKALRIAGIVIGGLAAAVLIAALVFQWSWIKPTAERVMSEAAGRDVRIGELDVDLGWTSRIILSDVRIANVEGREAPFAEVERTEIDVRIMPLLEGRYEIPRAHLLKPRYDLYRDADGNANWRFGPVAEAVAEGATPDERSEFPVIGALKIEAGHVVYQDDIRQLHLEGAVNAATGAADEGELALNLEGDLQDRPVTMKFVGGSVTVLREADAPYPVDLALDVGKTSVRVEGTVTEPVRLKGLDIALKVAGPTMAEIFPIFRIPLPDTPPYSVEGRLSHAPGVWKFTDFSGVVGDSDLSGSLTVENDREVPFLSAELVSNDLDFDDLAGFIGGTPDTGETANAEQVARAESQPLFPATPIRRDRLHAMKMDVGFQAKNIRAEGLPITAFDVRIRLQDGRVEANPLDLAVAGGTVSGEIALNGRDAPPSADADLTFRNLDLKPFFRNSDFVKQMGGRFFGNVYVIGQGESLADMMASLNGDGAVAMRDGSISALLVEAAGLDLVEALGLVFTDDSRVAINCGRADLDVKGGQAIVRQAVIDTDDSVLIARGGLNLTAQEIDMQVEARAKDFSLIDMNAPVAVTGPLSDPGFSIGGLDPLPFFELGDQEDLDCAALVEGSLRLKREPGKSGEARDGEPGNENAEDRQASPDAARRPAFEDNPEAGGGAVEAPQRADP